MPNIVFVKVYLLERGPDVPEKFGMLLANRGNWENITEFCEDTGLSIKEAYYEYYWSTREEFEEPPGIKFPIILWKYLKEINVPIVYWDPHSTAHKTTMKGRKLTEDVALVKAEDFDKLF